MESKKVYLIQIINLSGIEGDNAFYRELGCCFDFVRSIEYATKYEDPERCERILKYKDTYCKMFAADDMKIIELNVS